MRGACRSCSACECGADTRPALSACEASLHALGVEAIGLYQFHRPDPKVPFAESVGALAELKAAGKVRLVGLSNVSVDQINQARELVDVASVQNEFSPRFRRSEASWPSAPPRGSPSCPGARSAGSAGAATWAAATAPSPRSPRPTASRPSGWPWPGSWPRPRWSSPIPGASRPETITDSLAAVSLRLSDDDLVCLDRV
jgi:aryl-alcohol dehydrogenase-like predicted oxidoreductase